MTSGIYAITNTVTGEQYIGASGNMESRWKSHLTTLRNGRHNHKFQPAWNQYGEDAFVMGVLEEADMESLAQREQHFLEERRERAGNDGYNVFLQVGLGLTRYAESDSSDESPDDFIDQDVFRGIDRVDELAGYVNQQRAMEIMGLNSKGYLAQLVRKGVIRVVRWDDRTLLYDRRSVERYHGERQPRKREQEQQP